MPHDSEELSKRVKSLEAEVGVVEPVTAQQAMLSTLCFVFAVGPCASGAVSSSDDL